MYRTTAESSYSFKNTFLTQVTSINVRTRESPSVFTKMRASQRGGHAVISPQGEVPLSLIGILDQAFEAPSMSSGLRRRGIRAFQRACSAQTSLPHLLTLSNISKERDVVSASGRSADIWKGRYNGNSVCVKAFRTHTAKNTLETKQRLFQEIMIWRRLSHPNVLPVLCVFSKPFSLCFITEWMINGNIMDFSLKNPEVNRLRLLAGAASGLRYLHSMRVIHGDLKPENILIDRNYRPRLAGYGISLRINACPRTGAYTEKKDISVFGTVVYQVLAEQQHSSEANGTTTNSVLTATLPSRPPDSNMWLSDDIRDLIFNCWSSSLDLQPDLNFIVDTLEQAGDAMELRSMGLIETELIKLLKDCRDCHEDGFEPKSVGVQQMADVLSLVLDDRGLHRRKRRQYQTYLRRLCGTFGILPQSFILKPTFDNRETEPFAAGGSSDVYKATINGSPVAIKTLKVTTTAYKKAYKHLAKEVIEWKWLQHDNILPFLGVLLEPPQFSILSERMENGNIMDFIKAHPNHNRSELLLGAASGLKYLHDNGLVHGDLKGANILIDLNRRARLADFGLTVAINESTPGSSANHGMRGTIRWMAPEMMHPDEFGFTPESRVRLPSRSTDIYSLGMTIFEVIMGSPPFSYIPREVAVMFKVVKGVRPDRPSSGFPDELWMLLEATWRTEYASQPSKRPRIPVIIDQLRKEAHNWREPTTLPSPVQTGIRNTSVIARDVHLQSHPVESTDGSTVWFDAQSFESTQEFSIVHLNHLSNCPPQTDSNQAIRHNPIKTGIAHRLRRLFSPSFFRRLVVFFDGPVIH